MVTIGEGVGGLDEIGEVEKFSKNVWYLDWRMVMGV